MKNASVIQADNLPRNRPNNADLENERKQLREDTIAWISHSALSRLRLAWAR